MVISQGIQTGRGKEAKTKKQRTLPPLEPAEEDSPVNIDFSSVTPVSEFWPPKL